jgi:fatty-acyl-CoA synthase
VLDFSSTNTADLAPPGATPTIDTLSRRIADFDTLAEALDYAAQGRRGMNFHDARGSLSRAYPYSELREDALANARRFVELGIRPGERIALIAETGPEFAAAFFGAIYAAALPVPLPLPTSFGGRQSYVDQIKVQLESCGPSLFLFPPELAGMLAAAAGEIPCYDWTAVAGLPETASPIFQRIDALPAWGCDHPPRPSRKPSRTRHRAGGSRCRPLHLLAALVP